MRKMTDRDLPGIDRFTKLYLPMFGLNNSTTILDKSFYSHTVTANGNAKIQSNIFKNNGSSCYFDGTNSYLTIDSNAQTLGTTNSQIAVDVMTYWLADSPLLINSIGGSGTTYTAGSFTFYYTNGSGLTFGRYTGSSQTANYVRSSTSWVPSLNTWYHLSCVWNPDGTASIYVNGIAAVLNGSTSSGTIAWGNATVYAVGGYSGGSSWFNGYLSDFRISDGTDRGWTTPTIAIDNPPVADPNVVLHLPMNGANNGTTFVDTSLYNRTVTRSGAVTSTSQSKWNGSSGCFNGSSQYLYMADSDDWYFGSSDFTVHLWVYFVATTDCILLNQYPMLNRAWGIYFLSSTGLHFTYSPNGVDGNDVTFGGSISANNWYHVAAVRSGGNLIMYLNGTQIGSTHNISTTSINNSTSYLGISKQSDYDGFYFNGYMSDLVIIKGSNNGWTGSTIPVPTAPFPSYQQDLTAYTKLWIPGYGTWGYNSSLKLMFDFNDSVADRSLSPHTPYSNAVTQTTTARWGSNAGVFDGSSKYIIMSGSSDYALTSQDFAMGAWIYFPSAAPSSNQCIFAYWPSSGQYSYIFRPESGTLKFYYSSNGTSVSSISGNYTWTTGTWYWVCAVRTNGTLNLYAATASETTATLVATGTPGTIYSSQSGNMGIGVNPDGNIEKFNGYMDDLFMWIGAGHGVTDKVPTAPLYTSLCTAVTDKSAYRRTITNTNVVINPGQSKFNGSAMQFDGSSKLEISDDDAWNLGTDNWFISLWVYPLSFSGNPALVTQRQNDNNFWIFNLNTSGYPVFENYASGYTLQLIGTSGTTLNSWNHVLINRTGTSFRMYVNGTSVYTGTSSGAVSNFAGTLCIGSFNSDVQRYTGYISDLIIGKGSDCGYTGSTIPVPSKPFSLRGVPQRSYTPVPYDGVADGIDKYTKLYLPLSEPGNAFTDKSFYGKTVTNSSVTSSTSQSKFGGSSAVFDGSARFLTINSDATLNAGTGPFFLSFWVKADVSQNTYSTLFCNTASNSEWASGCIVISNQHNDSGLKDRLCVQIYDRSEGAIKTPSTINDATWHFVVICRNTSDVYIYIDGTLVTTAAYTGNFNIGWHNLYIGKNAFNGSSSYFKGYLQEVIWSAGTSNGIVGQSTISVPTRPAQIPYRIANRDMQSSVLTSANPVLYLKGDSPLSEVVWTARTELSDINLGWPLATSADGLRLVTTNSDDDYTYVSSNQGATWTKCTSLGALRGAVYTSSADGLKLAMIPSYVGYVYTSTDGGGTWTQRTTSGSRNWIHLVSSSNGTILLATTQGSIYKSTDSGATWTEIFASVGVLYLCRPAMSDDGSKIAFLLVGGASFSPPEQELYVTSTNGGTSWSYTIYGYGSQEDTPMASSSDGSVMVSVHTSPAGTGYISTSTDYGQTWSVRRSEAGVSMSDVRISADGLRIVACGWGAYIYTSVDGASSWSTLTTAGLRNWSRIVQSDDGTRISAGVYQSYLYTQSLPQVENTAPSATSVYAVSATLSDNSKYGKKSLSFDGVSSWLKVPYTSDFTPGYSSFVFSTWLWIKALPSTSTGMNIFDQTVDANNYQRFQLYNSSGTYQLKYSHKTASSETIAVTQTATVTTAKWYYVVLVKSGNSWRIYLDGVMLGSVVTDADPVLSFPTTLRIGGNTSSYFNGYMDDILWFKDTDLGYTGSTIPVPQGPFKLR